MISDAAFSSLRMAATLAMTLPSLRVRISSAERVLVEVGWMGDDAPAGAVHVRPCAFRRSVACARARREEGHPVALCGLGAGADPGIDVVVGAGGHSLPGDIFQVRVEGGWRHVVASTLGAEACFDAIGPNALVHRFSFQEDEATGVTIVHAGTAESDEHRLPAVAQALLEARGRLLTEELLAEVA